MSIEQDLAVGGAMASDYCETLYATEQKLDSRDAKLRMYVGFACGLAGIMRKSVGSVDAAFVLGAALQALNELDQSNG